MTDRFNLSAWLRQTLREWLLSPEERQIVERVDELDGEIRDTKMEWDAIKAALDSADVWGEDLELDSVDILILAGRNHHVEGAEFGDGLYISRGAHAQIFNNRLGAFEEERDRDD